MDFKQAKFLYDNNMMSEEDFNKFNETDFKGKVVTVEDKLSKSEVVTGMMLKEIKRKRKVGDNVMLVNAMTGSGKTYALISIADKNKDIKLIITVPNVVTVVSMANEYNNNKNFNLEIVPAYADNPINSLINNGTRVIFSTLDQLRRLRNDVSIESKLKEYTLVVDEAHTLVNDCDFKHLAVESFEIMLRKNSFNNVLFITATNDCLLNHLRLPNGINIAVLEVKTEKHNSRYDVRLNYISKDSKNKLQNAIDRTSQIIKNAKGKTLVHYNLSKREQEVFRRLFKWEIINSDNKKSDTYKSIIETNLIPEKVEVLCSTDLFSSGMNLYNKGFSDIVTVGETSPEVIRQLSGRFRLNKHTNVNCIVQEPGFENITGEQKKEEILKEIKESVVRVRAVGVDKESCYSNGYVDNLLTAGLSGSEIEVSMLAVNKNFLKYINRNSPDRILNYFRDRENVKIGENFDIPIIKNDDIKEMKDKIDREEEIVEEEKIEIMKNYCEENFERFVMNNKLEGIDDFCIKDRKTVRSLMNKFKKGTFDLEDFDFVYQLTTDKEFHREMKYRIMRVKVDKNGTKEDFLLHLTKTLRVGDYNKEKVGLGDRDFRTFKKIASYVVNTENIKNGFKVLSSKGDTNRILPKRLLMKSEEFFCGFLRKTDK